jgi:phosphatidylglycerol:prolipoprotein diacylglycerol transferase
MLTYPHIDPVALSLGPIKIHWYGIMYLVGFGAAWSLARFRARRPGSTWTNLDIDDLIFYCAIGVILGGRIGWCLVYGHDVIAEHWSNAFHIWDGGMSFHGGLVGVITAVIVFGRVKHKRAGDVFDFLAPLPGIGILAVRIGNFINGELWGRPTDVPWAFRVPNAEGELIARFAVEWVRLPDANIGYLAGDWLTMGMLLTTPMIVIGAGMMMLAYRADQPSGNVTAARA